MIVESEVRIPSGVFFSATCDKDSSDRCRGDAFPSGARAAVGLPSVPPQRLIRNDCSSRDTRSRGCTANLRHKIAKGAVAQDSEHKKIVHTQPLRSARDRGYRSKTPIRPEDRERTRSLCCCMLLRAPSTETRGVIYECRRRGRGT